MALRVSQALMQQVLPQMQKMGDEIINLSQQLNEQRYINKAIINVANHTEEFVLEIAQKLKITDWQNASDADDVANNFSKVEEISTAENVVMFTSTEVNDASKGIFRSKMKVADFSDPTIISAFIGKKVGDAFSVSFNQVEHTVVVLGVRAETTVS
jgi:hypothetical protein